MHTVTNRKIVFNGKLRIESAEISNGHRSFERLRINREDAAVVLVWHSGKQRFILTRQFRYPLYDKLAEPLIEAVAGKVEQEDPVHTAIRETEEEIGYKLREEQLQLLCSCFAAPGYSTERYYIYSATVSDADKVSDGGGLEEENEEIETVELPAEEFYRMIHEGEILDSKTLIAGFFHQQLFNPSTLPQL